MMQKEEIIMLKKLVKKAVVKIRKNESSNAANNFVASDTTNKNLNTVSQPTTIKGSTALQETVEKLMTQLKAVEIHEPCETEQ